MKSLIDTRDPVQGRCDFVVGQSVLAGQSVLVGQLPEGFVESVSTVVLVLATEWG
jgi:hypothetical protein